MRFMVPLSATFKDFEQELVHLEASASRTLLVSFAELR